MKTETAAREADGRYGTVEGARPLSFALPMNTSNWLCDTVTNGLTMSQWQ